MAYVDASLELRRAEQAIRSRRHGEAIASLWRVYSADTIDTQVHADAVRMLAQLLDGQDDENAQRVASLCYLFCGAEESAVRTATDSPLDTARARVSAGNHLAAAQSYQEHGWLGHAALCAEQGGGLDSADKLWSLFLARGVVKETTYEAGLARFNRARVLKRMGSADDARREAIRAIQLLEMAADVYESHGERERAFDCFAILLQVGEVGAFENLAEGYLNSIRVLAADNLQNYVVQYYDDFYRKSSERQEFAAASSVARDAAHYCQNRNLPYAAYYRREAARAHVAHAEHLWRTTANAPLVENAYAAAIDDFLALGAFAKIADIYERLAGLPVPDTRKARYRRLASRVERETDRNVQFLPLPDHLRSQMAYPDIWRVDIEEFEVEGEPCQSMISVLLDSSWPSFTRTRALACALFSLHPQMWGRGSQRDVETARLLGRTEIYAALAPLERMSTHPDPSVRVAVMQAASSLYFKRTFRILKQGVRDANAQVRKEAIQTVSQLYFPHALDPLQQIFEETDDASVRRAALTSIGQIDTPDATKLLSEIVRHGSAVERSDAQKFLRQRQR